MPLLETPVLGIQELMRVTGHSRIPIHEGDLDNILGLIHVKDLTMKRSTGMRRCARTSAQAPGCPGDRPAAISSR